MDVKNYWDDVYGEKLSSAVSWFKPHLDRSLSLIRKAAPMREMSVIDVGGGESTLVDDLLADGYSDVSVLDISHTAIDETKRRLGVIGNKVTWWVADVTRTSLPATRYDVWHDRAVFHFLTESEQRRAYVQQVMRAVRPGGHVIVATFGPEGPTSCSGLDVVRYNPQGLHNEFKDAFQLVESSTELHQTPFGTSQQFIYCYCIKSS